MSGSNLQYLTEVNGATVFKGSESILVSLPTSFRTLEMSVCFLLAVYKLDLCVKEKHIA